MNLRLLRVLLLVCNILFALGLFAPCLRVVPQFGELTSVIRILRPSFDSPQTISIASGIHTLFINGEYAIGLVILTFTIIFPLWKFGVFWESALSTAQDSSRSSALHLIEKFGKFSMLDVYVLALLVISIKGLPGGSLVELRWGLFPFVVAIILTMRMPQWLAGAITGSLQGKQPKKDEKVP
jgi:paraquat-inducible protein A